MPRSLVSLVSVRPPVATTFTGVMKFHVCYDNKTVAEMTIQVDNCKYGLRQGTVHQVSRVRSEGHGAISVAYCKTVPELNLDALKSSHKRTDDGERLWRNLRPFGGLRKFRVSSSVYDRVRREEAESDGSPELFRLYHYVLCKKNYICCQLTRFDMAKWGDYEVYEDGRRINCEAIEEARADEERQAYEEAMEEQYEKCQASEIYKSDRVAD